MGCPRLPLKQPCYMRLQAIVLCLLFPMSRKMLSSGQQAAIICLLLAFSGTWADRCDCAINYQSSSSLAILLINCLSEKTRVLAICWGMKLRVGAFCLY